MKRSLISVTALFIIGYSGICYGQAYPAARTNVLDASPQVGTGGYNMPAPSSNYGYSNGGLGNLYITGNVTAGKQFRGFVPYSDPTQFHGRLGSAALSTFEGDAPNLNRVTEGYRSGQALPYYFRSSTLLPLSAQFQGLAVPGSSLPRSQVLPQSESYGLRAALPRPESAYPLPQNLKPADILIPDILTAENARRQMGYDELYNPRIPEKPVTKEKIQEKVTPEPVVTPEPLMLQSPTPEQPAEPAQQDFSAWLTMQAEQAEKPEIKVGPQAEFAESAKRLGVEGKFTTTQKTVPAKPGETKSKTLSSHAKPPVVSELTGKGNDAFSRMMRSAQKFIIQGRYHDAYQQYTEALAVKAGDPLAVFGQTNALIGAGDLRSAAQHLELGMSKFPKFVRLEIEGPRLLGGRAVLERRKEQLESMVDKTNEKELGLLLGYLELLSGERQKGLQHMSDSGLVPIE